MGFDMYHILIIEDEDTIRNELAVCLKNKGYKTSVILTFDDITNQTKAINPDLILLDINLPHTSGFAICAEIRMFSPSPIIFVTSRNSSMDELNSVMLGGDAYITKPYFLPLLLAKINQLLSKIHGEVKELTVNGITLHLNSYQVSKDSNITELSKNEFKILHLLMSKHDTILSRNEIIEHLWDNEFFVDDNTLTVNITRIRNKLDAIDARQYIKTIRGQGYTI